MKIDENHWLTQAKHVPSPHFDSRPDDAVISLLVLHHISLPPLQYGGPYIEQFFQGKLDASKHPFFKVIEKMKVSAHCLIRRDGQVVQFVPFNARAWHAGKSSFAGKERCNDYSIGIELEGSEFDVYSSDQYQSLALLSKVIMQRYPAISPSRVTGHQYISPLRKSDPGLCFDWKMYRKSLK